MGRWVTLTESRRPAVNETAGLTIRETPGLDLLLRRRASLDTHLLLVQTLERTARPPHCINKLITDTWKEAQP